MDKLNPIILGPDQNYAAYFLTLACNLRCPYCINTHSDRLKKAFGGRHHLTSDEWIKAADRLVLRDDLPLTLQGGEPTLHKGFYDIVNKVKESVKMDLLTNMQFDEDEFVRKVPVARFTREAPYAAIRVSYHPDQNDIDVLIKKTFRLQDAGFRVGIYSLAFPEPEFKRHIDGVREKCLKLKIDFRYKEFLGEWNGRLYGTYRYEGSVSGRGLRSCECRTTELIVDPAGYVYRCHADLYNEEAPIAHILDDDFDGKSLDLFRPCDRYGDCNPCDVKVKTNRFQISGHTSVEIRNIKGLNSG